MVNIWRNYKGNALNNRLIGRKDTSPSISHSHPNPNQRLGTRQAPPHLQKRITDYIEYKLQLPLRKE